MLRAGNTECVALCDIDRSQIEKTQDGIAKTYEQKADLQTQDFRQVLDRNDIDAVIVATPDHWHALPTVETCKAGKDVYVKKPLAITVWEGRQMVNAARKYDRVVQMGTQQRSGAQYLAAKEYIDSGKLGRVDWYVAGPILTGKEKHRTCLTDLHLKVWTTTCGWGLLRNVRSMKTTFISVSAGTGITQVV